MRKKIRIGISQREIKIKNQKEIFDALDQSWHSFSRKCNFEIIPISNKTHNVKNFIVKNKLKGFILTGGGPITKSLGLKKKTHGLNSSRDHVETKIFQFCIKYNIPIIGVCRGMEVINILLGGKIARMRNHRNTKHYLKPVRKIYKKIYNVNDRVNSYHEHGITKKILSHKLLPIYLNKESVEMFIGINKKIMGIMWHPERNLIISKKDINLFKKFFIKKK